MQIIEKMKNLDEIDLKIIRLLRENGRMSLKELSSEVFLTPPAVAARIEKLSKEGYIKGIHAKLNMEKLLIKKYKMVSSMAVDQEVKTKCEQVAAKHQEHFNRLMSHLN